eukprot:TRINITY_DN3832_c0_g1_i1.p1 TRINITY_DN3832_c0_g1~~TRINITY_DN3832_c0_g1_i1.p1  ORF type:complete len:246 (-),score=29.37 TRINITY_DN3832_c0_g1_i1:18-755(-)
MSIASRRLQPRSSQSWFTGKPKFAPSQRPSPVLELGLEPSKIKSDSDDGEDTDAETEAARTVSLAWKEIANERFRDDAQPEFCDSPCIWLFSYYDSETGALENVGCMRVHHRSFFRKCWDALTAILLIWMAFSLPITVGFKVENNFLQKFDLVIDLCFLVDLVLGFLTTFEDHNKHTVTELRIIAKEYLSGWFIVDFVSSLPVQWLGLDLYVPTQAPVSYTHLRAHETVLDLVCRLLLEKKKTEH